MSHSVHANRPNANPTCTPGPRPERLKPGDRPNLFMFDAAMVDESDSLFPFQADHRQYARLMSLSAPSDAPVIFGTSPLEHQLLDSFKEKAKKAAPSGVIPDIPNLRNWTRAGEGHGIVKRYRNIRGRSFAHQQFVLSQTELETIQLDDAPGDVRWKSNRPPNFQSCPPADRDRCDLRLRYLADGARAFLAQHPGTSVFSFLKGPRITARYRELKREGLSPWLDDLGSVETGYNTSRMYANLDRLGQVDKIGPLVQPVAYGSAHLESSGWSDLIRRKGKWLIDPKFEPRYRVPKFLRPRQNHVIRIILDSCIFEGREEAILNFVDRFDGDVQLTSLPEIESEVKFGRGGSARKVWYDKIMLRKPSTRVLKKEVLATTKPTFYGESSRPIAGLILQQI